MGAGQHHRQGKDGLLEKIALKEERTDDELHREVEAEVKNEKMRFLPESPANPSPWHHHVIANDNPETTEKEQVFAPILEWLHISPPERDWIVDGLIPAGAIGVLTGSGSVGKSNFTLALGVGIATGLGFGPFRVERPRKVLMVNAEDPEEEIWRRFHRLAETYPSHFATPESLAENLMIFTGRGQLGPLMSLEKSNPTKTQHAATLTKMLLKESPDLLILDTKSRLYGLSEDSNDHAAQWVSMLEEISEDCGCGILIVHHVAKGKTTDQSQHAGRGASSLIDNARFGIALTPLNEDDGQEFAISDPENHFLVTLSKLNYGPWNQPWLFRRLQDGIPEWVGIRKDAEETMAQEIAKWITTASTTLTRRELLDREEGRSIREHLKELYGATKRDVGRALERGLFMGLLFEQETLTGQTNQMRREICATDPITLAKNAEQAKEDEAEVTIKRLPPRRRRKN